MKSLTILFSILFLVTFNSSIAQKVKREATTIKYLRAAKFQVPSYLYYNVDVEEKREELDGSISEKKIIVSGSATEPRTAFYVSKVSHLNGFHYTGLRQEAGAADTLCLFSLNIGQTQTISSTPVSENILNEAKQIIGVRWYMRVTINVPVTSSFSNEKGEILITQNGKAENILYSYPNQFSKTSTATFSSKDALNASFNTNKAAFMLEMRDNFISAQINTHSKIIGQAFNDDNDFFGVDFYSVKGKKGEFDDLDLLLNDVSVLLEEIQENFKLKNNLNWHSEAMKTKFTELGEKFGKLLSDDLEKSKNAQPTRFTAEGQEALLKNVLWCKFFIGEFDFVIKEANRAHAAQSASTELLPEKVYFDNIIPIAQMYQPIYLNNKARFNWF